jgi:hypothetical protein
LATCPVKQELALNNYITLETREMRWSQETNTLVVDDYFHNPGGTAFWLSAYRKREDSSIDWNVEFKRRVLVPVQFTQPNTPEFIRYMSPHWEQLRVSIMLREESWVRLPQ